MIPNSSKEAF